MRKSSSRSPGGESRIAVIEESADNIYSMCFILQSLGYNVTSIEPRRGFIEELQKFAPKVVLVDMLTPSGRALAAIQEIRKAEWREVRILAVTADAVPFSPEEIRQAGADEVIVKPYTVSQMQKRLSQYL